MLYTKEDVMDYVAQEDVKFIRLAFCDIFGRQKNISIMPHELSKAFDNRMSFSASAISGFESFAGEDIYLCPDPSTMVVLPWRPSHGRVIRMFCELRRADGSVFELDCRSILKSILLKARERGIFFSIGTKQEFYLFNTDENGAPTLTPFDNAGFMDIAPDDKGENIRRQICLNLEAMGILPENSHHEHGPGQQEIVFEATNALEAADTAVTFKSVVKTTAFSSGLYASFDPKPLPDNSGNSFRIRIKLTAKDSTDYTESFAAGILSHIEEMTLFLNPAASSFSRFGHFSAPKYITWSCKNLSQLVRVPECPGEYSYLEIGSPDPETNPYLAFSLILLAGLDGIDKNMKLSENDDFEYSGDHRTLPLTKEDAVSAVKNGNFVKSVIPQTIIDVYSMI